MSTSLLYHAFGVRGYAHVRTEFQDGEVYETIKLDRRDYRCSECGSADVIGQGGEERVFRTLPIGRKSVFLRCRVPRVFCRACGVIRQVKIHFAEPRVRHTRAFERYALELSQCTTIQDAARHLGISWDTIKDIQKRDLQRRFGQPKLKNLKQIAIDEIAIAKGHRYLTLVLDLDSGAVVYIGDGKGADALGLFWKKLKRSRAKVKAVATDMSIAYIQAVQENLPSVVHVFDHFHVIKLFNDKLSAFRRELHREATDRLHKDVLKGTRWLLLKNPENLDPNARQGNERERLEEALRLNQPLATVYYMKEDLRRIWLQGNKKTAHAILLDWVRRAEASGIKMLQKFGAQLAAYRTGVLAYYDARISTGPLEGTNNKIKTMKRQAYGYRDQEFFKLKILGVHEAKYALVG